MEPNLCVKGCDFFGAAENRNMCSKSYTDFVKSVLVVRPSKIDRVITAVDQSCDKKAQDLKKNMCDTCKKKVRVLGFECRCGGSFCGHHRLPEQHECDVGLKAQNRTASHLPLIEADKLNWRI